MSSDDVFIVLVPKTIEETEEFIKKRHITYIR